MSSGFGTGSEGENGVDFDVFGYSKRYWTRKSGERIGAILSIVTLVTWLCRPDHYLIITACKRGCGFRINTPILSLRIKYVIVLIANIYKTWVVT